VIVTPITSLHVGQPPGTIGSASSLPFRRTMKPDVRLVRLRTRRPAVASLRTGRSERVTQMIDPHDDRKIFGGL
jgi:hypothetical protein